MKRPELTDGLEPVETAPSPKSLIPVSRTHSRISVTPETVRAAISNIIQDEADLVWWLYDYARQQQMDFRDVERATHITTSTLYRIFTGKYIHHAGSKTGLPVNLAKIAERIRIFKRHIDQKAASGDVLPFVDLNVWKRISLLCSATQKDNDVNFLIGDSQLGKSRSLVEYSRRNPRVAYAMVPPAAGPQFFIREIAKPLNVCDGNYPRTFARIVEALGPGWLLVLDDFHVMVETCTERTILACLAITRQLRDRTGCGLVISSTNVFHQAMKRAKFEETFKQLARRGTEPLNLGTAPEPEDIVALCAHYGLSNPALAAAETVERQDRLKTRVEYDIEQLVNRLCSENGLGKFTRYLSKVARKAAEESKPVTWYRFARHFDVTERASAQAKK